MTLQELNNGSVATIKEFSGELDLHSRLVEMGIMPGVQVRKVKTALFGGPIELKVRNYHLTIRQDDAKYILVEL